MVYFPKHWGHQQVRGCSTEWDSEEMRETNGDRRTVSVLKPFISKATEHQPKPNQVPLCKDPVSKQAVQCTISGHRPQLQLHSIIVAGQCGRKLTSYRSHPQKRDHLFERPWEFFEDLVGPEVLKNRRSIERQCCEEEIGDYSSVDREWTETDFRLVSGRKTLGSWGRSWFDW